MSGFVYFIQAGKNGPIKIGFSTNPGRRMTKMQADNHEILTLRGFISGTREDEQKIQAKFADLRISGEWFSNSPVFDEFMRAHSAIAGCVAGLSDLQISLLCAVRRNEWLKWPEKNSARNIFVGVAERLIRRKLLEHNPIMKDWCPSRPLPEWIYRLTPDGEYCVDHFEASGASA